MLTPGKIYTTTDLCNEFGISDKTFRNHKSKYLMAYEYEIIKQGRSKAYKIISADEDRLLTKFERVYKKSTGITLDRKLSSNAEIILSLLYKNGDYTLLGYEGIEADLGSTIKSRTIRDHIKKFREDGLVPFVTTNLITICDENGEIIKEKHERIGDYFVYAIRDNDGNRTQISKAFYSLCLSFLDAREYYKSGKRQKYYTIVRRSPRLREFINENKSYLKSSSKYSHRKELFDMIGGRIQKLDPICPTEKLMRDFKEYFESKENES